MDLKIIKDIYPNIKNLNKDIIEYYNFIIDNLLNKLIELKLEFLNKIPNEILKHINSDIYKTITHFNQHFKLYKKFYYSLKPLKFKKFDTNYSKTIEDEIFKKTKKILLENPVIDKKYNNINDIISDYKNKNKFNLSKKYLNKFTKLLNNDINLIEIILKLTSILTYLSFELIEVGLSNFNNLEDVKNNLNEDEELKQIINVL
jgi:hypothetical protein